jgi:drug/metabolite transporter (DMT)-like permease
MPRGRLIAVCALTLCAFASNSLLTRRALGGGLAGAASFAAIRLLSGAAILFVLAARRPRPGPEAGWPSAAALFGYAIPFSWAYLRLSAGIGAFLLFGSVQATMIAVGVARGERPPPRKWAGLVIALAGLGTLTLPGAQAPPPAAAAAMVLAGISWGWYSLRGRGARDAIAATADAFVRCAPLAATLWLTAARFAPPAAALTTPGAALALASGALASGVGYTLWNTALPHLATSTAALLQLSVPALAAAGGAVLLGEVPSARLIGGGAAILAGIALGVLPLRPRAPAPTNR